MTGNEDSGKHGKHFLDRIFPPRYDFEELLSEQAERTLGGVEVFVDWLENHHGEEPARLARVEVDVDLFRYDMEEKLKDAFSTPFDRQDIYSLSRQMDYILNYAYETAQEMHVFEVGPDPFILAMARSLRSGAGEVAAGVRVMGTDPVGVRTAVRKARESIHALDNTYILAMKDLFHNSDAIDTLKRREIYHHLRDSGRALRGTVDILHQAMVGIDMVVVRHERE